MKPGPCTSVTINVTPDPINQNGLQTEICNPLIILVRLAGIEPTTPWFVVKKFEL